MEKETAFKYIILEFQNQKLPRIYKRDYDLPTTDKIITIIGIRRSGKTFFLYQQIKKLLDQGISKDRIVYINFEDDRLFPIKIDDMNSFLEAYFKLYPENKNIKKYFFFDEIQVVPHWELFIRRLYDKEKVNIFITGSTSKISLKEISTELRGRTIPITFYPLNFKEFLHFHNVILKNNLKYNDQRYQVKKHFEEYLFEGGFPEVVLSNELKSEILHTYYEMIVYRDIVEQYSIRNTLALKYLIKYLLTNIGNIFSINKYYNILHQQIKISKETLIEYTNYLIETNFIFLLRFFSYSIKQQQVNSPKVYCIDNGLRNNIAFTFSNDEGRLAENLVFLYLSKKYRDIFYWKGKNEVDFVVLLPENKIMLINVFYSDEEFAEREFKGFEEFIKKFPEKKCKTLIITKNQTGYKNQVKFKPLWEWVLEI
ncbi:MAG: ATP-binding protein [Candidatus Lokiarchaeota archaeon]|nr:ATP-binding protein [Candidatus Harpocratesius repetitus]